MTNINQEIADLKAKLAELEKKVAGDDRVFQGFRFGESYWLLCAFGYVSVADYNTELDECRIAQGNAFHTEAEAIRERDKRALLQELKAFRNGYRFIPSHNSNWSIVFLKQEFHAREHNAAWNDYPASGWFPSREEAERAIAHFGDRLNLLREG